ncbi:glycosyltransferase family 4 protein [Gemmatimonadota bacterium]
MLRAGGIGRYLREITGPWLADHRVEAIRFLGRPEELEPWLEEVDAGGNAEIGVWRDRPYSPRAQLRWPGLKTSLGWEPDVTFFPHYDVPLLAHPQPSVVAVHDLIHFKLPQTASWWKRQAGKILLRGALGGASQIVTVSEQSRRDLLDWRPGLEGRVSVVPNGVSPVFRPLTPEERTGAEGRWGHLRPFALCMGEMKAHKNLGLVVAAVRRARREWPELKVVLVGGSEANLRGLRTRSGDRTEQGWIVGVDAPLDEDLRALMVLSEAFLFPSLYEGFGLPPLEAAACGANVLVSDRTPIPEFLRGYAALLDPEDLSGWVESLLGARSGQEGRNPGAPQPGDLPRWGTASSQTLEVLLSVPISPE